MARTGANTGANSLAIPLAIPPGDHRGSARTAALATESELRGTREARVGSSAAPASALKVTLLARSLRVGDRLCPS